MRISRKVRISLISLGLLFVATALTVWIALPQIEKAFVAAHQKSVTRSLAMWGREASQITNASSATHAVEMIEYMRSYYVPGSGYRGPAEVETELERQRAESIQLIAMALERYKAKNRDGTVDGSTKSNAVDRSTDQDVAPAVQ
jgi:hypothetical protein